MLKEARWVLKSVMSLFPVPVSYLLPLLTEDAASAPALRCFQLLLLELLLLLLRAPPSHPANK